MAQAASLIAALQRSALRFPGRRALQEGARAVSFDELARSAFGISKHLVAQGLKRGDRVALLLPAGVDFVAACYGVMAAGGVAVLLNAAARARELTTWLRDCEPCWLLAERSNPEVALAVRQAAGATQVFYSDADSPGAFGMAPLAPTDEVALPVAPSRDDPACIIYTSGTTGAPKGVVLSHGNLVANTEAIVGYLHLSADDSIVTVLPFHYAYGSSILHTHLYAGGCVIIEKNLVYPHAVVEALARQRATGFAGVPSTFALLLSRVKLPDYDLSGLRYVTQAGGAMAPALIERLRGALPQAQVFVMYGLTEATARLTWLPPSRLPEKLGSVGIAVDGVALQIRDEAGRPLPANNAGEVWARGPNVMLGYWRNEAATAQVKRDGWLKTGDMGRIDQDGFLYLAGRRSDMIKTGAHRVHPQDIEDVIAELPDVQEVAVVGQDDELLGQTIKAVVVPAAGAALTVMQVQAHCRAHLANYKIPKTVELVDSLPRTASGKVHRSELQRRNQS